VLKKNTHRPTSVGTLCEGSAWNQVCHSTDGSLYFVSMVINICVTLKEAAISLTIRSLLH
jgi:hypothetical protein